MKIRRNDKVLFVFNPKINTPDREALSGQVGTCLGHIRNSEIYLVAFPNGQRKLVHQDTLFKTKFTRLDVLRRTKIKDKDNE